jgi:crotonobetainyl-CoA:carnitine CoA-transferase CaiB-like acyl-CoA transferase
MNQNALGRIKVLDFSHYISGPYCTKLLSDFGSEVIKIENPYKGDPCRSLPPIHKKDKNKSNSLLFQYLNTNKKSLVLDLKSKDHISVIEKLIVDSDVLVENFSPGTMQKLGLDYETVSKLNPEITYVSISNFGHSGPYKNYEATDLIHYALGGLMFIFGSTEKEPIKHAFRQAQFKAGTNAASATLMAVYHAKRTGIGQHVDISIHESIASAVRDTTTSYVSTGVIPTRQSSMRGEIAKSPMKVSDGYVVPITFGTDNWSKTPILLDSPELASDKFKTQKSRRENYKEFKSLVEEAFLRKQKYPLFYEAHSHRELIYGVVQDAEELLNNPQYLNYNYFQNIRHPVTGINKFPGTSIVFSKTPIKAAVAAPTLGEHTNEILERTNRSKIELIKKKVIYPNSNTKKRILGNIRIVELGQLIAVPYATKLMSDMGAEVIRIESNTRPDSYRLSDYYDERTDGKYWNRAMNFNEQNRNKKGFSIELITPESIETLHDLIATSDIVACNYTPRVMANFGIEYENLRKIKPDIILLSSTGYGYSGPWSSFGAIGYGTEAASGLSAVTGYENGPPAQPEIPYPDYTAAEHSVYALMVALMHRDKTGEGQFIDISQSLSVTSTSPEAILYFSNDSTKIKRHGNNHEWIAPHGCYPCKGKDKWITITATNQRQWEILCEVLIPNLKNNPDLSSMSKRHKHTRTIDAEISANTIQWDNQNLMHFLQNKGRPAAAVLNGKELLLNEHLKEREFFQTVLHDEDTGIPPLPYSGQPWKMSKSNSHISGGAPIFGKDNDWVLKDLLGISTIKINKMKENELISDSITIPAKPKTISKEDRLKEGAIYDYDPDFKSVTSKYVNE